MVSQIFDDEKVEQLSDVRIEEWRDYWYDFLTNFTRTVDGIVSAYYVDHVIPDLYLHGKSTFLFDCADISHSLNFYSTNEYKRRIDGKNGTFADFKLLADCIIHLPDMAIASLRDTVLEIMANKNNEYQKQVKNRLRIAFKNVDNKLDLSKISVEHVGTIGNFRGLVCEYDDVKRSQNLLHFWNCQNGHVLQTISDMAPKICKHKMKVGEDPETGKPYYETCDNNIITLDEIRTKPHRHDYITFKIQQRTETSTYGRSNLEMQIEVIGKEMADYVLESITGQDFVSISGIVRLKPLAKTIKLRQGTLSDFYVEASYIERESEADVESSDEKVKKYKEIAKTIIKPETEKKDFQKIIRSMMPNLHLTEDNPLRLMVLLQLIGANELKDPVTKQRVRGSIIMMVVSDPGLAKSSTAEFYPKVIDRCLYNVGSKSTTAALLGISEASKDGSGGSRFIPGVFELGNHGVVILDEFLDKDPRSLDELKDAFQDNQMIVLRKRSAHKNLEINVAVLCLTNARTPSRRYDFTKDFWKNMEGAPEPIIDRMDGILIQKDEANEEIDTGVVNAVTSFLQSSMTVGEYETGRNTEKITKESFWPPEIIKEYIKLAKEKNPRLTDNKAATKVMSDWYMKWRGVEIEVIEKDGNVVKFPAISPRRIYSFRRWAEAVARACLRDYVTEQDAIFVRDAIMDRNLKILVGSGKIPEQVLEPVKSKTLGDLRLLDKLESEADNETKKILRRMMKDCIETIWRLSWKKCPERQCKNGLFYEYDGTQHKCDICHGLGGSKIEFERASFLAEMIDGKRYSDKSIKKWWDVKVRDGVISMIDEKYAYNNASRAEYLEQLYSLPPAPEDQKPEELSESDKMRLKDPVKWNLLKNKLERANIPVTRKSPQQRLFSGDDV